MNDMLQCSTGTRQQLPPQLFEQMGQYRCEVFINQLGWELNTMIGMELDEFDGTDAVYVCSYDENGQGSRLAHRTAMWRSGDLARRCKSAACGRLALCRAQQGSVLGCVQLRFLGKVFETRLAPADNERRAKT